MDHEEREELAFDLAVQAQQQIFRVSEKFIDISHLKNHLIEAIENALEDTND